MDKYTTQKKKRRIKMLLTIILAFSGCALLFLMIWEATVTMPFSALAKNFPLDVQEKLKPRLDSMPLTPKRIIGGIILVILILAWFGLFIVAGVDGKAHGFRYWDYAIRFLIIGAAVKVFDIVGLDFFLLTKTKFFQHYLPETEGCKGWKQFGYNRKQQIRQCIIIPICCLLSALAFAYLV
ncbi:MAG: hypothetical protein IJ716_16725 [Lachnospiraceae bacterium]|nr:hypothetical protein [Lachnospiraceae bacterium]